MDEAVIAANVVVEEAVVGNVHSVILSSLSEGGRYTTPLPFIESARTSLDLLSGLDTCVLTGTKERWITVAAGVITHPIKEDVKKKFFSHPSLEKRVVTCIQPCLLLRRVFGFVALDRCVWQRRCDPS